MGKQRAFLIPVNEVSNADELMGELIEEKDEGAKVAEQSGHPGVPGLPKTGIEPEITDLPGGSESQVDFVYGFFFFDMPSIYSEGNKIFFNGEVSKDSVNQIKQTLNHVGKRTLAQYHELGIHNVDDMKIELHINSPGGAVSAGFDLIDYMDNFYIPIHTVGTGTVASMGVMLLLAGQKRCMTKNSHMLVHQFRAGVQGKRQDIMDYLKHFDALHSQMINYIAENTNLTAKEVARMLKSETWLSADECLSKGFVDELK